MVERRIVDDLTVEINDRGRDPVRHTIVNFYVKC